MLNKKIIILINAFLVFNNYLYASQDTHQKPKIVVEQIPPIVKGRLAIAYFGGPEINNLIASAFMHEKVNARMSIYDAHYSINSGNSLNPILNALACLKEKGTKIDIRSIVDSENITKPDFLQFSNYLKSLGCQVKKLNKDPGALDSGNICLDPKSFLHQKFYLFKSCYQDGPLAIITSHNPTAHGATNYQKNNAIVMALPYEIKKISKRFNLLYKKVAIKLEDNSLEDNSLAVALKSKIKEFEPIKLDDLNLQKNNNSSDDVQLLKSPLFISHKSDSENLISEKIIEQIKNESQCIQLANFQFSHAGIVLALADALARGVRVECLIDIGCVTNSTNSKKANQLAVTILNKAIVNNNNNNGFIKFVGKAPSYSDTFRRGPILHNKFFTFKNSESVITGSFNCSGNSDIYGIELGIKVKEQELLEQYNQEFKKLVKNSSSLPLEDFPLLGNHKKEISKYSYAINGWAVDESGKFVYKSFVDSK